MANRIEIAVIPAAGLGTRLRPLSTAVPKELFPVGRWPMLQYAIVEAIQAEVEEIAVVLSSSRKAAVVAYLKEMTVPLDGFAGSVVEGPRLSDLCQLHVVDQPEPLGLADAVSRTRAIVQGRPFFLLLPDNVFFGEIGPARQLAEAFEEFRQPALGLIEVTDANAWRYGNSGRVDWQRLADRWVRLTRLHDKQPGSFDLGGQRLAYRHCGRYVLTEDFFELSQSLRDRMTGELDDVPVLQQLTAQERLIGVLLQGELFDTGHWDGYFAANAYWLKHQGRWN